MIGEFADPDSGGFYFTGRNHEELITRQKDVHDNATPSGNGMAATALLRLASLAGRDDFAREGERTLQAARSVIEQIPLAAGQSLVALDFLIGPTREFAVVSNGDSGEFTSVLEAIAATFVPSKVVAPNLDPSVPPIVPLLADRPAKDGRVTTYIARTRTCAAPVTGHRCGAGSPRIVRASKSFTRRRGGGLAEDA